MRLCKFVELLLGVILVLFSACSPPVNVDGIFPDPNPATRQNPPTIGEKFLPEHRRILEMTGWYEFAASNIDSIQYYDWEAFSHPKGPAIGLAEYTSGKRIASIALKNLNDVQACWVIVHEAMHLSGINQTGQMHGEQQAEAAAAQFWQKWLSLNQK
jgi:hypothetical protein